MLYHDTVSVARAKLLLFGIVAENMKDWGLTYCVRIVIMHM